MKLRWLILSSFVTLFIAQAQTAPAPAAAEGPEATPGVARTPAGDSQVNPPGPGKRALARRRPARSAQPGGPGDEMTAGGPGPQAGPGGPEGPDPEMASLFFEQADEPEEIEGPEDPDGAPADEMGPEQGPGRGGPGFGGGPGMPPPGGPQQMGGFSRPFAQPALEALQDVLGLDDGQARALRGLEREKARKALDVRQQFEQQQETLLELLEQEEPDGSALVSTVKALHALRKQAGEIEKEFQARTAATLNEAQRAKLKAIQDAQQTRGALGEAARLGFLPRVPGGPGQNGFGGPGAGRPEGPVPQP